MDYYGYRKEEGYPLAAWVWGHRLRAGQHWMEYLLEFLNVLAGFQYELGQGRDNSTHKSYKKFKRLGLRRFVFYDSHEKTNHPYDDRARVLLNQQLCDTTFSDQADKQESITLTQNLLKAFSAIEDARSWYAKSLFPAHENLLFWEALRKRGATKSRGSHIEDLKASDLDKDITFSDRNFFARGGEVYYLILSAGTETNPPRRQFICQQLKNVLQRNDSLGQLSQAIENAWQNVLGMDDEQLTFDEGNIGWILHPNCTFYQLIAEDIETFLKSDLDALESLDLLAHLIGFHLTLYIYHFSRDGSSESHADGSCLQKCRPILLVDLLDGQGKEGAIIRKESAKLFREQEHYQEQAVRYYIKSKLEAWAEEFEQGNELVENLGRKAEEHFNIKQATKNSRKNYNEKIHDLAEKASREKFNNNQRIQHLQEILAQYLMKDFRKNFLPVHRKLAKRSGFVAPLVGTSARFVFGDNLLKAILLATVLPGNQLPFGDFLERLFCRYGIVVGPEEAQKSSLFDRQRINVEYYDYNRNALLEKMKHSGLVAEYSDATALVVNTEAAITEEATNV
jgi:hypothetical protein